MRSLSRLTGTAALLAASGLVVLGSTGSAAADDPVIDVELPVTVCGISVGLLGTGSSACPEPTSPTIAVAADADTLGGILAGSTPIADADAPITVCGIGVGVLGSAASACPTPAPSVAAPAPSAPGSGTSLLPGVDLGALGTLPILDGQPVADADVAVDVCGIAVGVAGASSSTCGTAAANTGGSGGSVGVNVPVNVCGVSVGVLGSAAGQCPQTDSQPPTTTAPGSPTTTSPGSPTTTSPGSTTTTLVGSLSPGGGTGGGSFAGPSAAAGASGGSSSSLPMAGAAVGLLVLMGGALSFTGVGMRLLARLGLRRLQA